MEETQKLASCIKNCGECRHLVLPDVGDRMRGTGFMRCTHMKEWIYLSANRAPCIDELPCPYASPRDAEDARKTFDEPSEYDLFAEADAV